MNIIRIVISLFLIFIVFIIIESMIEIRQLKITRYDVYHNKLPKIFNGYKIILMADLHNCFYNSDKIIETIKEEAPHAVVIAGDMLVYGDNKMEKNKKAIELVKNIATYADVFYAPGNHEMGYMVKKNEEWLTYENQLLEAKDDNVYYMDNKVIELSRDDSVIKIYGLHLTDGYYKRLIKKPLTTDNINKLLGNTKDQEYNILIAHNPDYFEDYCKWGADLVLSGHNHGGLMRLPILGGFISPRLRIFPKYDYGRFDNSNSTLVLSGGLGAHSLKIRVNNKPELVVINLNKD